MLKSIRPNEIKYYHIALHASGVFVDALLTDLVPPHES